MYGRLIPTVPALIRLASRCPLRRISGPDRRHQPVLDVVRDPDRVLLVLERDDRDHRPEDLLLRDRHRVVHPGNNGRRIERVLPRLAAEHDLGAFTARALDERVHALAVGLGDQRAHLRLGVQRVAHLDLAGLLGERDDELVVEPLLDEDPRARLAALAGRVVDRPDRARDRRVEVGVREDDVRALAAELQRQPLDRLRAEPHDLAAGLRGARERDLVDAGVPDEVGAGRRAVAGDDVDRPGGEPDLGRELREPKRRRRCLRVGLEDDGAAGRERRRELPRGHQQRVVPRNDLAGDADRLLQRVGEDRAADRVGAAGDRRDRRGVEAEVLDGAEELCLRRGDRLADVARLELGELLPVRGNRVRQRVQEARALVRGRLAPVARRALRARPRRRGRSRPRRRAVRSRTARPRRARSGRATTSPRRSRR